MARTAVASATSHAVPLAGARRIGDGADARLGSLRKQLGYGRRFRPNRNHVALLVIIVIGFWFLIGFARTITQLNAAADRQAVLAAETRVLSDRLNADQRELRLIQTDAFQALQARAYGIGTPAEIAFSVDSAGPASRVVPLGSESAASSVQSPLDAWLALLFGD